jgi:hypothetical protein
MNSDDNSGVRKKNNLFGDTAILSFCVCLSSFQHSKELTDFYTVRYERSITEAHHNLRDFALAPSVAITWFMHELLRWSHHLM